MKKTNKNQLVFEFSEAVSDFKSASENLANSFERLSTSSCTTADKVAAKKVLVDEVATVRARIDRVIKSKARTMNLRWDEVWRIAYERLRRQTRFDAIAQGLSKRIRPIEAVCKAGYQKELLVIATNI